MKTIHLKSLKAKIYSGFLAVMGLVLLMGIVIVFSIAMMNNRTEKVLDEELPLLLIDEQIRLNIAERASMARGYILYGQKSYRESFDEYTKESDKLEKELEKLNSSKAIKNLISQINTWEDMVQNQVFEPYSKGNRDLARANFRGEVEPVGQELMDKFKSLSDTRATNIEKNGGEIIREGSKTVSISIIISAITILLGLGVAYYMANSLSRPIIRVAQRMQLIAEGDLAHDQLKTRSQDEVGQLVSAVNSMNSQLRTIVSEIGNVSEMVTKQSEELSQSALEVNTGSRQVASTMEELAIASEAQATSTSELAESMTTLSEHINDANEHGGKASNISRDVMKLTEQGNEAMTESIFKMQRIDENVRNAVEKVQKLDAHSKQISQLVNVISNIAEQTNLLALNAAIEAARAGEHGRGFAVVAGEVKKLSEQVASSVSDITGIVSTIQKETDGVVGSLQESFEQVEQGTAQIKLTGMTFEKITDSIKQVVEGIEVISEELAEIVSRSEEMNASISNIASISEEASAGIEETSASAEQTTSSMQEIAANAETLSTAAGDLDKLIRKFKV